MIPKSKLETTDIPIHPALRSIAEKYSGELNIDFLFRGDKNNRVALNLVAEPTGEKRTIGIAQGSATLAKSHGFVTSISSEAVREDVYRYSGELCYSGAIDRKIHSVLLRFDLQGVENERQGASELELMARDLRRIYVELNYTPHVYKNGTLWR